jgi:hypothetical protein
MSRANPFSDLSDFEPQPVTRKVPVAQIEEIAEASGFPSRKAATVKPVIVEPVPAAAPARAQRRYTTGRNRQINIKATDETIDTLYRIADEMNLPLGAVLEEALTALEARKSAKR